MRCLILRRRERSTRRATPADTMARWQSSACIVVLLATGSQWSLSLRPCRRWRGKRRARLCEPSPRARNMHCETRRSMPSRQRTFSDTTRDSIVFYSSAVYHGGPPRRVEPFASCSPCSLCRRLARTAKRTKGKTALTSRAWGSQMGSQIRRRICPTALRIWQPCGLRQMPP